MRICEPTRFQRGPPGRPVGRIRDWHVRPIHRPSGCRAGSCLWASYLVRPRDGSPRESGEEMLFRHIPW